MHVLPRRKWNGTNNFRESEHVFPAWIRSRSQSTERRRLSKTDSTETKYTLQRENFLNLSQSPNVSCKARIFCFWFWRLHFCFVPRTRHRIGLYTEFQSINAIILETIRRFEKSLFSFVSKFCFGLYEGLCYFSSYNCVIVFTSIDVAGHFLQKKKKVLI